MSNAGVKAAKELLENENVTFFHEIAIKAEEAMEKDVHKAMKVFYNHE